MRGGRLSATDNLRIELLEARKRYEATHAAAKKANAQVVDSSQAAGGTVTKVEAEQLPLNNSINGAGPTSQAFWGMGEFMPYHLERSRAGAHGVMQFL